MTREIIEQLKGLLIYGDQGKIARFSGVSKVTINRFYNGKEEEVSEEIQAKIVRATHDLIEARQKTQKAIVKKTMQILN
jgi:DNA-binding LacI/PurR family transcriptional regulator